VCFTWWSCHMYSYINGYACYPLEKWHILVRKNSWPLLITLKEKNDVSIFQPLHQLGFIIHNCWVWTLMTYCIVLFQLSTLFKLFKTQFLFSFRIHNCESEGSNDIFHCDTSTLNFVQILKSIVFEVRVFYTIFFLFFQSWIVDVQIMIGFNNICDF
jgi:hypothetical protein